MHDTACDWRIQSFFCYFESEDNFAKLKDFMFSTDLRPLCVSKCAGGETESATSAMISTL